MLHMIEARWCSARSKIIWGHVASMFRGTFSCWMNSCVSITVCWSGAGEHLACCSGESRYGTRFQISFSGNSRMSKHIEIHLPSLIANTRLITYPLEIWWANGIEHMMRLQSAASKTAYIVTMCCTPIQIQSVHYGHMPTNVRRSSAHERRGTIVPWDSRSSSANKCTRTRKCIAHICHT